MRRSSIYLAFVLLALVILLTLTGHARRLQAAAAAENQERTAILRRYSFTDLCLFTEARYTRHPAMADRFAPFQDHPGALEHFPSGALLTPPAHLYADP